MCLRPASPLPVPDDTAHVARLAFPRGNLLLSLRDRICQHSRQEHLGWRARPMVGRVLAT